MKTALLRSAFLFLSVLAVSISLRSQTNSSDASLAGKVTDLSGYGVGGVRITAQLENGSSAPVASATSSPDGAYLLRLPRGRYRIHFQRASFAPRDFVVDLATAENRTLDVRLDLERVSENVVVTANAQPLELDRTAAPVDLLGHQEIEQRQAVSLPDLLATQTGVSLARTGTIGGLATIFVDGGNSNFTKVLVDGTPVNEPGGVINFSNFTLDNVDKVEIVQGAESALYGTDAMSGVIQIFSHRGETRIPEVNLFTEGGSFSSARGGAQVSGLLGGFDYSAAGSYFQTSGQGVDDAFLNRSFAGNLGYRFSDSNQLRLTVRSNASFAGTPGQTLFASIPFAVDTTAYDNLKQLSSNLTWSFRTGSHWAHRVSGMESRILDTNAFPDVSFFVTDQFNRSGFLEQSTYSFRRGAATMRIPTAWAARMPAATTTPAFSTPAGSPSRGSRLAPARARKPTPISARALSRAPAWSTRCAIPRDFGAILARGFPMAKALKIQTSSNPSAPILAIPGIHRYVRNAAAPSTSAWTSFSVPAAFAFPPVSSPTGFAT